MPVAAPRLSARSPSWAKRAARTFVLENLYTAVDHPGAPLPAPSTCWRWSGQVAPRRLRLNLDLYHAQIGEGNLLQLVPAGGPFIGEIQVADVPGPRARHGRG